MNSDLNRLRLPVIVLCFYAAMSLSGCGCGFPYGYCGDTGQPPIQEGKTRAVFGGILGGWSGSGIDAYVDTPRFPITIQNTLTAVPYSVIVTGNAVGTGPFWPDPIYLFVIKPFGYKGPKSPNNPNGPFDSWSVSGTASSYWVTDPRYPGRQVSFDYGSYLAGLDGTDTTRDMLIAQVKLTGGSNVFENLGRADLTWRFTGTSSSIVGSKATLFINEWMWVQATADLPEPITYSWAIDGVDASSYNGPFANFQFSDNGSKTINVLLTGSDGSQILKSMTVWVKCLPPAPPYADDCNVPPER